MAREKPAELPSEMPADLFGGGMADMMKALQGQLAAQMDGLKFGGLDHVGIAVRDAKAVLPLYQALGLKVEVTEDVESEGVRTTILGTGFSRIELLEPLSSGGAVAKFLKTRGEGIHHVAVKVPDIEATLKAAQAAGLEVSGKAPRPGARGRLVAFFHPKSMHGVLLEIVQDPAEPGTPPGGGPPPPRRA